MTDPIRPDPVLAFLELSPEQMLDAVETLGIVCDGRFLVLNSYENRVYRIGVEDGPPVVAKFYRPSRWSDEAIIEEHRFTTALEEEEIPVIAPLADDNGNTLHHAGPFRFSLYPYRGGRAPDLDDTGQLEMLGRFIGRIHALGAVEPYRQRPAIDVESFLIKPSKLLLDQGFIPGHLETGWKLLMDELAAGIADCYARAGSTSAIRLHGDLHPGNILWTDAGPHIVDFDDARMGPAVQDLWMFLSGESDYMAARLQDLLKGYRQFHDFNQAELQLLEAMRTLRMVHHAGWLASRWQDPAFPAAFGYFDEPGYWQNLLDDLRDQLGRMQPE